MIKNCGWFVYLLSAIAEGNAEAIKADDCQRYGIGDSNVITIIAEKLATIAETGFARTSRRGWTTLEHPQVGMVQWKSGYDFRTTGRYFFLRINGKQVVACWPKAGDRVTHSNWECNPQQSNLLGYIEK